MAPLPSVEFPTITVTANYPGASPQTMATAVATPLETQFGQIPGLSQMTSVNVIGTSQITLQFDLSRNIDAAANDVLEAINAAGGQLPKDMPNPPTFRKTNPADAPILIMGVTSDTLPMPTVDNYAENILAQQLSQVTGVSQVLVGGQQTPAVRVQVDPGKLAGLGLTLEDVRNTLGQRHRQRARKAPSTARPNPTRSTPTTSAPRRPSTTTPSSPIAATARCGSRDIGHAIDGPQNRELQAWQNNKPAVLLLVFKQPGANVISTVDARAGAAAAPAEKHPARRACRSRLRPHPDHPRLGQRRGDHAADLDRAGGHGHLRVPAQRLGDDHPQHHHPGRPRRHAGRDVRAAASAWTI